MNVIAPNEGAIKHLSEEEIQKMSDRELVTLIWGVFGVAVDFGTSRKDIVKMLWRLSS